ncbi:37573_t:CDS:2, partial [Gigaspora margarita]
NLLFNDSFDEILKEKAGDYLYYSDINNFPSYKDVYNNLNIKLFNLCEICFSIINRPKEFCINCEILNALKKIDIKKLNSQIEIETRNDKILIKSLKKKLEEVKKKAKKYKEEIKQYKEDLDKEKI